MNFLDRTLWQAATLFLSAGAARADLNNAAAIKGYETVLSLYGEAGQTSLSPEQADRHSRTLEELGLPYTTVGNVEAAGRAFTALLANLEQRSRQETDASVKRDLAISHIKLANIKMVQGDLPTSFDNYETARSMLQELTTSVYGQGSEGGSDQGAEPDARARPYGPAGAQGQNYRQIFARPSG
ncbi:hypothetical protein NKI12_00905 [Mesorhizobium australicum]|uniref:Uncharacterized protein n=1 Tax=Mesorhizobium australicum TaxID=536018 RepID=A0ACC6T7T1_9HYPH